MEVSHMTRMDRNLLLALCLAAAPLLLTACAQNDAAAAASELADKEAPIVQDPKVHEVVITASRLDPYELEEEGRALPN
jgi:outer membrane lipoprotein-sorting protein